MLLKIKYFRLLIVLPLFSCAAQKQLIVYPSPGGGFDHSSGTYSITVKQDAVKPAFVYVSHAGTDPSQKEWGNQQGKSFHYSVFSFLGAVTVTVTKNNSTAKTAIVRPAAAGIGTLNTSQDGNNRSVSFSLAHPAKISVEFDDDPLNKEALMIFADKLENKTDVPDIAAQEVWKVDNDKSLTVPAGKSIVYFAPGIYSPGMFELPQQVKQVYIAGGAFVRGYILANRNGNQSLLINGRGVLSNDAWPFHYPANTSGETDYAKWYKMIKITGGNNHRIEGITFVDPSANVIAIYSASNNTVENINVNGFRYNNDAVNLHGDHNIVNNCFFRDNEDVIGLNGDNTTIQNCIFWQLHNGSMIQLGWAPHNISGHTLITDCTILHGEWDNDQNSNIGFINVMNRSDPKEETVMENFTVKNIVAETEILRFVDLRMTREGTGHPLSIKNFTFENIHLKNNANGQPLFYMTGYDDNHKISNVTMNKVYVNDELMSKESKKSEKVFKVDNFSEAPVFKQ